MTLNLQLRRTSNPNKFAKTTLSFEGIRADLRRFLIDHRFTDIDYDLYERSEGTQRLRVGLPDRPRVLTTGDIEPTLISFQAVDNRRVKEIWESRPKTETGAAKAAEGAKASVSQWLSKWGWVAHWKDGMSVGRTSNPGVFVAFVPGGPIYGVSRSEDGARREGETYYPGDRKALRVAPATDALAAFLRQNLDTADAHEYVVGPSGADVARRSNPAGRAPNHAWPSLNRADVQLVKHVCRKAQVAGKPELVNLSFGIVEVDPRGLVGDPKGDDVYGQVQGDGWYAWSPPDDEDRSKAGWAKSATRTPNPASRKRLGVLQASLEKKKAKADAAFDTHFSDVKAANGQPLNDKRNGAATLNRWEKQSAAIRNAQSGVAKTERAIEREAGKLAWVEHIDGQIPQYVLDMVASGELNQWRRHPNTFFVPGVEKGRVVVNLETGVPSVRYLSDVPKDQYPAFRDTVNKLLSAARDWKKRQDAGRTQNPDVPSVDDVTLMQLTHSKDAARAYRKLGAMLGKPMVFLLGNGVKILFSNKAPRPNLVQIELMPSDTYRVSFGRKNKDAFSKVINDVYAENLREIFERETGLYLSV